MPRAISSKSKPQTLQNIQTNKTMGMIKEFKEFAMKGNVVDLAIL
jgi:hypothetical protein